MFGGDGPSRGPLLRLPVCGPTVTSEPWRRPCPSTCGSLTWLFPRYVQEVIQRGRSCVRPACTPVLSVVPAVSDLELSETEYVRPPRVPVPLTQTARGPGPAVEPPLPGQDLGRRTGRDGPGLKLSVSVEGDAGRPHVTRGQQAREEVLLCLLCSGPCPPPAFTFPSFLAGLGLPGV